MTARPLDHVVLPVIDIATARRRLTDLGFTVAADARHPFGTENACVFFRDKTYLEPLGVASAEECRSSARAGNQFTARNHAFRFRHGPEGLSSIAFGTSDAAADDAAFRDAGLSGGEILEFSRIMKLPDGTELVPTFRLAFAVDLRSPDFHGFTCQRINVPNVDRSALETHPNGVTGIKSVILSEPSPDDFLAYLGTVTGEPAMIGGPDGAALKLANSEIRVLNAKGASERLGLSLADGERGLRGRAIIFSVADPAATEACLAEHGISYLRHGETIIVAHQAGQGVLFGFEGE
jgi:catechol 2,3-dioxygenase-like lactoylglutathione lyase family enzyme